MSQNLINSNYIVFIVWQLIALSPQQEESLLYGTMKLACKKVGHLLKCICALKYKYSCRGGLNTHLLGRDTF